MKKILAMLVIALITGCQSTYVPPLPAYSLPTDAKIAVLIDSSNVPKHTHIGTTIFNNFEKNYPYQWNISESIKSTLTQHIETAQGFKVIDANSIDYINSQQSLNFVDINNKQWQFVEKSNALRNRLIADNVHAFIIIKEVPTLAVMECSQYGCTNHYSQGVGLFTRSMFAFDTYYASASYQISVELLSAPVDLSRLEAFEKFTHYMGKNIVVEDFPDPQNFDNITEQEFLPIKQALDAYFNELGQLTATHLQGHELPTNQPVSNTVTSK